MALLYLIFMIADMVLAVPMWKIGKKFGSSKPYWQYCIPIYNLALLCRFAGIPVYLLFGAMTASVLVPVLNLPSRELTWLISFMFFGYLSLSLASALGKNKSLWFILGGTLFFIPLFLFGFDPSTPETG